MSLHEIIVMLVQIALFFAFPAIWAWLMKVLPWWPFNPDSTFNILVFLAVTLISWILGFFGIKRFVTKLRTKGLAKDVRM